MGKSLLQHDRNSEKYSSFLYSVTVDAIHPVKYRGFISDRTIQAFIHLAIQDSPFIFPLMCINFIHSVELDEAFAFCRTGKLAPIDQYSQKSSTLRPHHHDVQSKKKIVTGSSAWMRIDRDGNTMMIEADKYAIMHRVGIHARDLRILDPQLTYPSTILGRERAIVVNLESIKAIVTADEVLLRNSESEDVIPFIEKLKQRLAPTTNEESEFHQMQKNATENESEGSDEELEGKHAESLPLTDWKRRRNRSRSPIRPKIEISNARDDEEEEKPPFEFAALEVALEYVCTFLDESTSELENAAYPALDALTSKVSILNLERVRKLKIGLSRLSARVQKVREELEQLLDDDGDMAEMFLTRKIAVFESDSPSFSVGGSASVGPAPTIGSRISRGMSRGTYSSYDEEEDVEELEQLLEAYFSQVEGTSNRLNTLREYIDDTEDYINIQLDNHRNQLIQLELVLNTATTTVGVYSVIAGVFGMNIPFKWNEDERAFKWVVIIATLGCSLIFGFLVGYAKQRKIIS